LQVVSPDPLDLVVVVDPDAEPADWDAAILTFLDRVVERRRAAKVKAGVSVIGAVDLPQLRRELVDM
jgi:hypothetical protein